MADLALEWGADLALTPGGDLLMVDGSDQTRQRIERRLFTAVRAYIWHPSYGAGLPQRIGRVAREREIQALVASQIRMEATVAQVPVPKIAVTQPSAGLFAVSITYTDAITGAAIAMRFEVPGTA